MEFECWGDNRTQAPSHKHSFQDYKRFSDPAQFCQHAALVRKNSMYSKSPKCLECAYHYLCDGLTNQYAERFGFDELVPKEGEPILDVTSFCSQQTKYLRSK